MFSILDPFFHALSDGKLIRHTVAWVLRILAVLMGIIGPVCAIVFIIGIKASDSGIGTHTAGVLIGSVLFAIFALAWGYVAVAVLLFRARTVAELDDSHFTVLPILSLLFRLNGEMAFVTYSLLGVGGCLFMWFADFSPFSEIGMLEERIPFAEHAAGGFLSGVEFAVFMLLLAFACIVFFYALAELTVVWVEIALNTRNLRLTAAAPVQVNVPPPAAPVPAITPVPQPPTPARVEPPPAPVQRVCKKCGQKLDAGSTFCDECGTPVD